MSTITYTLSVTPVAGTINQAESVWLGGQRFFVVFDTTGTVSQNAAIIDGSADLYTSSTILSVTNNTQTSTGTAFGWPPKLFKLASNLVLCVYTTTTPSRLSTSSTFVNARVYAIDSSNNITIASDQASIVPASFLNYQVSGTVGQSVRTTFETSSCVYYKPADNHLVFFTRDFSATSVAPSGYGTYTNSFYDLSFSTTAATVTVTKRWTSAAVNEATEFVSGGPGGGTYLGWWHLLSLAPVPGTTLVLAFDNGVTGPFVTQIAATPVASQVAYQFDYTSLGTTPASTITGIRLNSAIMPLDSTRTFEFYNGTVSTTGYIAGRINTSGNWGSDLRIDSSAAVSASSTAANLSAAWAHAPIQHLILLDSSNYFVILGHMNSNNVLFSYGMVIRPFDQLLQVAPYGLRAANWIFFRGNDPLVPRSYADGSTASTYDFFAQVAALKYEFFRYDNPS